MTTRIQMPGGKQLRGIGEGAVVFVDSIDVPIGQVQISVTIHGDTIGTADVGDDQVGQGCIFQIDL